MNSTVNTAAATTSQNDQGTSQTPACTQTRVKTITLMQNSTVAQNEATETRTKTTRTGDTTLMPEVQAAVGCLEQGVLALRGAVLTQREGTKTRQLGMFL